MRRRPTRPLPIAGLALALAAAACTAPVEGDDDATEPQASCYDAPAACIDATGAHHSYVIDSVRLPASSAEALRIGLDLDGDGGARVDNQLGAILAALAAVSTGSLQDYIDARIADGTVILLADVQASGLDTARDVGLRVRFGANPQPAPCADETDTVCRRHLQPGASIEIDSASAFDVLAAGNIRVGQLAAGPIEVSFELNLDILTRPVELTLIGARARAAIGDEGLADGVVAGAVAVDQIVANVLPAVAELAARDCPATGAVCCQPDTAGAALVDLFDADGDCALTVDELAGSDLLGALLRPDVDLLDVDGSYEPGGDGAADSISLGVGFTGVSVQVR